MMRLGRAAVLTVVALFSGSYRRRAEATIRLQPTSEERRILPIAHRLRIGAALLQQRLHARGPDGAQRSRRGRASRRPQPERRIVLRADRLRARPALRQQRVRRGSSADGGQTGVGERGESCRSTGRLRGGTRVRRRRVLEDRFRHHSFEPRMCGHRLHGAERLLPQGGELVVPALGVVLHRRRPHEPVLRALQVPVHLHRRDVHLHARQPMHDPRHVQRRRQPLRRGLRVQQRDRVRALREGRRLRGHRPDLHARSQLRHELQGNQGLQLPPDVPGERLRRRERHVHDRSGMRGPNRQPFVDLPRESVQDSLRNRSTVLRGKHVPIPSVRRR